MGKTCTIEECGKKLLARGWCSSHYRRWQLYGDPMLMKRLHGDPAERFWRRIDADGVCWEWGGYLRDGYGRFRPVEGEPTTGAHIWAYTQLIGPVPDGLELDHLCRNRKCVNPDHLEPVPKSVNGLRGSSPHAINARKTECHRGHPFTEMNTYIEGDGGRRCRECRRIAYRTRMTEPNEVVEI